MYGLCQNGLPQDAGRASERMTTLRESNLAGTSERHCARGEQLILVAA
jgi:hypothetical protein